jgi:hypothetical protein
MMPVQRRFKPVFIHIRACIAAGSVAWPPRDLTPSSSHP